MDLTTSDDRVVRCDGKDEIIRFMDALSKVDHPARHHRALHVQSRRQLADRVANSREPGFAVFADLLRVEDREPGKTD